MTPKEAYRAGLYNEGMGLQLDSGANQNMLDHQPFMDIFGDAGMGDFENRAGFKLTSDVRGKE